MNTKLNIIRPWTANSLGILSITKNSLFAVDYSHNPILIKGQMTANFGSPATIYAIKFDRYWTALFEEKLSKFIRHQLPEAEYFIVQNIHTKFTVKNDVNNFNVAVDSGEVKIGSKKIDLLISHGKQITFDKNGISETNYINFRSLLIIIVLIISLIGTILFRFRKTKIGGKIIILLKQTGIFVWKLIKKLVLILWKGIKSLLQLLINRIKKLKVNPPAGGKKYAKRK